MIKLDNIDLCDAFDAGWKPSTCGLTNVLAFLSQHATRPYNAEIVRGIVEVDIQRSWFAWHKRVETSSNSTDCEILLKELKELPRLTGYRSLLEEVRTSESHYLQLARLEYEVRNQSGDMIGPAYYQAYFGVELPDECGMELRRVYCSGNGPSCSALARGLPLRGLNLFGRRRSADDRNLDLEFKPEGNRIIIAPKDERRVSRIQASLQILNTEYVCFRNEGSVNPLLLLPGEPLGPGEARIVKFPFDVRLPNLTLKFR